MELFAPKLEGSPGCHWRCFQPTGGELAVDPGGESAARGRARIWARAD